MARAIEMPVAERKERWEDMMAKIRASSIDVWRENFLHALREAPFSTEAA